MGFLRWTKDPIHAEILKVYQILMYWILHIGTHSMHSCSLLSSLIFIIKIYYVYFFFFLLCAWYAQRPMTLWIQTPSSTGELYKNAYKWEIG